ncbi:MAG: hypothetical protein ACOYMG_26130 [Candidatus Methylumidiphilus sp.]
MSEPVRTPVWLRQVAQSKRLLLTQIGKANLTRRGGLNASERQEWTLVFDRLEREATELEAEADLLEQQP